MHIADYREVHNIDALKDLIRRQGAHPRGQDIPPIMSIKECYTGHPKPYSGYSKSAAEAALILRLPYSDYQFFPVYDALLFPDWGPPEQTKQLLDYAANCIEEKEGVVMLTAYMFPEYGPTRQKQRDTLQHLGFNCININQHYIIGHIINGVFVHRRTSYGRYGTSSTEGIKEWFRERLPRGHRPTVRIVRTTALRLYKVWNKKGKLLADELGLFPVPYNSLVTERNFERVLDFKR